MMTMMMMVLFPRLSQRGRPNLIYLLLVTTFKIIKNQDCQDFIRESAELFESDGDKKSKQRLADFTKSELLQRLIQLEKEEHAQKSRESEI